MAKRKKISEDIGKVLKQSTCALDVNDFSEIAILALVNSLKNRNEIVQAKEVLIRYLNKCSNPSPKIKELADQFNLSP